MAAAADCPTARPLKFRLLLAEKVRDAIARDAKSQADVFNGQVSGFHQLVEDFRAMSSASLRIGTRRDEVAQPGPLFRDDFEICRSAGSCGDARQLIHLL
jgi:hypothetical protein